MSIHYFLKHFGKNERTEMGLQLVSSVLSPTLKTGTTLANFSSLGKSLSVKDVLIR